MLYGRLTDPDAASAAGKDVMNGPVPAGSVSVWIASAWIVVNASAAPVMSEFVVDVSVTGGPAIAGIAYCVAASSDGKNSYGHRF